MVTADDFGISSGINRGIAECINRGAISAVSICVTGEAVDEAISLAKKADYLSAGLHLTLVETNPLLPTQEIKSLVNNQGKFRENWKIFLWAYLQGKIKKPDLEKEIKAQFRRIADSGLKITHVNSHQHLHLLPGILDVVISLNKEYRVPFIRCPYFCPGKPWRLAQFSKIIQQCILNGLCYFARRKIKSAGLKVSDNTSGVLFSGKLDENNLKTLTRSFKNGLTELICHPAHTDNLTVLPGNWNYGSNRERQILCQDKLKKYLKQENISLVSFPT